MHPAVACAVVASAVAVCVGCGSNLYVETLEPPPEASVTRAEAEQAARDACDEFFNSQIWEVIHVDDEKGDIVGSYAQPTSEGIDAVRSISANAARAQQLHRVDGRYDGLAAAVALLRDRLYGDRTEILDVEPGMEVACSEVPGWRRPS